MKRITILLFLVLCLWGCDSGRNEENMGTGSVLEQPLIEGENIDNIPEDTEETTEIRVLQDGEIHYSQAELEILKAAVGEEEDAQYLMEQVNGFGFYNIIRAEYEKDSSSDKLEIETSEGKVYVLYLMNDSCITAVRKDGRDGEFIYMVTYD